MGNPMRLAPCVPHWVMIQREAEMQIDSDFIHCAAFVGNQTERGFRAEGTCFFVNVVEENHIFPYAVTARHVIDSFNASNASVRAQRKPPLPPRLIETGGWINHPDRHIDICTYPIDWRDWDKDGDLDLLALDAPRIFLDKQREEYFGFGIGSDIFIPSAFVGLSGEKQNIPVIRFGHVAAMALEPNPGSPRKPAFLIETRSLGGMSGSPVMFHTEPGRTHKRQPMPTDPNTGLRMAPYLLVGILVGTWHGQYAGDFLPMGEPLLTDAEFNSGISVALPVSQIIEVLYQKALCDARNATLERLKQESGFRPTS
jgi:hypothetical protein